jgi:hypothetical protein
MIYLLTSTWINNGGDISTEFARSRAPRDPDTEIGLMGLLLRLGGMLEGNTPSDDGDRRMEWCSGDGKNRNTIV